MSGRHCSPHFVTTSEVRQWRRMWAEGLTTHAIARSCRRDERTVRKYLGVPKGRNGNAKARLRVHAKD